MVNASSRRGRPLPSSPSVVGKASSSGKRYKGVRMRSWGRWVSEIRIPHSRDKIWLGSYATAKEAARAYDAAAFLLRGAASSLNFPSQYSTLSSAALSTSPRTIQAAAATAAAAASASTSSPSGQSLEHHHDMPIHHTDSAEQASNRNASSGASPQFLAGDHDDAAAQAPAQPVSPRAEEPEDEMDEEPAGPPASAHHTALVSWLRDTLSLLSPVNISPDQLYKQQQQQPQQQLLPCCRLKAHSVELDEPFPVEYALARNGFVASSNAITISKRFDTERYTDCCLWNL